jgi:hypothetical protein
MKKLMLTIASMLFVSVLAVNAQVSSDTTSTSTNAGQPTMSDDQSNYTRDMEAIQSSEVPASLRSTLQGSEYSGWEEGKVYRNSTTNEYLIVIGDEDAKVYRFDANGTRIEDATSGSGSSGSGSLNSGSTGSGSTGAGSTGSGSTGTGTTGSGTTGSGSTGSGTTGSGSSSGSTGSGSTSGSGTTGSGSTSGSTGSGSTSGSGSTGSSSTMDK